MKKNIKIAARKIDTRMRVRIDHDAGVEIMLGEETVLTGRLRNISQQGLYFTSHTAKDHPLWHDRLYLVKLSLQDEQSTLVVKASGRVARLDTGGCAIRFIHPLVWWPVFSVFPVRERKRQLMDSSVHCSAENFPSKKHWVQDLTVF